MILLRATYLKAQEWRARTLVCGSGSITNLPASLRRLLHLHVKCFTLYFSGHLLHRVLVGIQGAKRTYRCFEELKTFPSGQGLFLSLVKSISSVSASSTSESVHS